MASVIFHAFNQIQTSQKMKLFRSHNKDYKNGEQLKTLYMSKMSYQFVCFYIQIDLTSGIYSYTGRNSFI